MTDYPIIVVDTSAIIAVAFGEQEAGFVIDMLEKADRALISTVSVVEARMVVHGRKGERAVVVLNNFLSAPVFDIVPPGVSEMNVASDAFVLFGKGSGHPANLNFGDLFSYALAKTKGIPLLFKGKDFAQTDIEAVRR